MAERSVLLKLAGDHGKEKDLDGSTGSIPPRSADAKLVSAQNCKRVAAHVQALTMPAAIKPGGTLRLAELNSSAEEVL